MYVYRIYFANGRFPGRHLKFCNLLRGHDSNVKGCSEDFNAVTPRLESTYSLIWGAHEIWGQDEMGAFGTFMISRLI